MTSNHRRDRLAERIAALEAKLLPPRKIRMDWVPGPLGPGEEYFIQTEENTPTGRFRLIGKRPKQK